MQKNQATPALHASRGRRLPVLALALFLALQAPAYLPATARAEVHPEIQKANEQRARAERRQKLLLLFPAAALGITIALIIIKRR